jgi:AhpD family alkylhydroperoxidase
MRSPLTVGERELIAAYVSALNACEFCHGAHVIAAEVHGIPENVLEQLIKDPDSAPVEPKLKPLLDYVAKLTSSPSRITPQDAEAIYEAGWDERALFDVISICALFNMMNRIVLGSGIVEDPRLRPPEEVQARRARMGQPSDDPHRAEHNYSRIADIPNEQKTQQSPFFGRNSSPQAGQS